MNIFKSIIIVIVALLIFRCQDDVKRQIQSVDILINDSNKLSVSDSIYFINNNSSPNRITILSDVPEVNLYFSVNKEPFKSSAKKSLSLQIQDSIFQYFLAKAGFDNSAIKTIVFPEHSSRFLNKISLNAISLDSTLNIDIVDKSRGTIKLEMYTIDGRKLIERNHSKSNDKLAIHYAFENYPSGIYLVLLNYGKDFKAYKIVKK